jgi:hypothetical protein
MTTCTAAWNQVSFRGRNDDGDQATATWKALQNTNWTQAVDEIFRVRFEMQETAGCAAANVNNIQLQYNLNAAGWVSVTATSGVVQSVASPNVADAAATTDQLSAGTGTFEGDACFDEVNGVCGSSATDVSASGHVEPEFCVQILSADVVNNDTVQLRITRGGTAFAAYDATPSVTVSESSPVVVTPSTLALVLATFAAVVTATANVSVTPTTASLSLSTFAPTVTVAAAGVTVTPTTVALTTATFAPTVSVSDNKTVTPTTAALSLSAFAPTVTATANALVTPGLLELSLSAFAPTVTATGGVAELPDSPLTHTIMLPRDVEDDRDFEMLARVAELEADLEDIGRFIDDVEAQGDEFVDVFNHDSFGDSGLTGRGLRGR